MSSAEPIEEGVSVVVRTRDRLWFLQRALRSIQDQTAKPREIVVVNDGGERTAVDRVAESAMARSCPVSVVHHDCAQGRSAAWNAGIGAAQGAWIATLDDDDTWEPGFLAAIGEKISQESSRCEASFGVVALTNLVAEEPAGEGWRVIRTVQFNAGLPAVRLRDLVLANRFTNNAFVFPKRSIEIVGPIRKDLPVLEDWEFNVRFAARFPIVLVPKLLANYHRRDDSAVGSARNTAQAQHQSEALRLRESWLREDLASGRFGLGVLSMLAELESNRGLRLFNKVAALFGR